VEYFLFADLLCIALQVCLHKENVDATEFVLTLLPQPGKIQSIEQTVDIFNNIKQKET